MYKAAMRKTVRAKTKERSEDEILDQATRQLMRALKDESDAKGQPITRDELRREGYSERFIGKFESSSN